MHVVSTRENEITIRPATLLDVSAVTKLAYALWNDSDLQELHQEMRSIIPANDAIIYLAFHGEDLVGFAQFQLRVDYVEGTSSSPVGYLEGVYVEPAFRHKGIARRLVEWGEAWSKDQGCREFASDCELKNTASIAFHAAIGFTEANRLVCFTKSL